MVGRGPDWPWSSAAVHCGAAVIPPWLDMEAWSRQWNTGSWHAYLEIAQDESDLTGIRDCTYSGRPLGSLDFTRALEKEAHRVPTPQKRGPKKQPGPALPSRMLYSSTLSNPVATVRRQNHRLHGSGDNSVTGALSLIGLQSRGNFVCPELPVLNYPELPEPPHQQR